MIKNPHRIFIAVGVVCILFAISLTAYNFYADIHAGNESDRIVNELHIVIPQEEQPAKEDPIEGLSYYQYEPDYEMPTTEIDGVKYIGILSIPELDLEFPVASEWSYPQLKKTPCRYSGSAYSNDLVICAHNYRNHFGRLSGISEKTVIVFTDADGNVFHYEVYDVEILKPNQAKEMKEYDDGLTLFTCTLGGRTRMTMRTVLIEDLSAEK